MLERIDSQEDLYQHKLGSAHEMEQTVLKMLDKNIEEANDDSLKQLLRHHQDETRQQITNIEQAFASFGWDVDDSPCLPMEAIDKEARMNIAQTKDQLVDAIILGGAAETEHFEMAIYDQLILGARTMGKDDVVGLLQQNREQEQHTLDEVMRASEQIVSRAG
jgi:ferritin-like metal-binding protein YciE